MVRCPIVHPEAEYTAPVTNVSTVHATKACMVSRPIVFQTSISLLEDMTEERSEGGRADRGERNTASSFLYKPLEDIGVLITTTDGTHGSVVD